MATLVPGPLPPRFADLKREIAGSAGPDFEQRVTTAWIDLLAELAKTTAEIEQGGSEVRTAVEHPQRTIHSHLGHPSGVFCRAREPHCRANH